MSDHDVCSGKVPYFSRANAKAARRRVMGRRRQEGKDGALSIYVCPSCGHLHLGHLPTAVRNGALDKNDWLEARNVRD